MSFPIQVLLITRNSPFYIYSNPITPAEAAAAIAALDIVTSHEGLPYWNKLRGFSAALNGT